MTATVALTTDLQRQVLLLEDDLRARLQADAEREANWKQEHHQALEKERTAASWVAWRDDRITQVAVAWVLTTVFIRFCEDNALVSPVWIAGPQQRRQEALDAQLAYFRAHPEHTDREWLQSAIDYLAGLPATKALVESHSALHLVSPSGDAITRLLDFWRTRRGSEDWDDLDGGAESLTGYRSVLRGPRPVLREADSWQAELDGIAAQVRQWINGTQPSIAVGVPERLQVAEVVRYLEQHGVTAAEIGPDGPRRYDAVHVGTLHRFKGLEYQRVILAGICDGVIPRRQVADLRLSDPLRYRREMQRARSLLFVAATRARDSLVISWHGAPSPFLPAVSRR